MSRHNQSSVLVIVVSIVMVAASHPAHADLGDQLFKLLPDDGATDDHFGILVAISDTTAIVGATGDDFNGTASGSAYLFDIATGRQLAKLLPDDGAANDHFGSVAISGDTAIVGAWGDDDNGTDSGSAYLFDISDPANPVQTAKLLADDGAAGDRFAIRVAISGATAVVGQDSACHRRSRSRASVYNLTVGRRRVMFALWKRV